MEEGQEVKVWILVKGENCEGAEILGVYATPEKAEEAKTNYLHDRSLTSIDWIEVDEWEVQ